LFFLSVHVVAQTQTARLVGAVHDASGAIIPGARVTATQDETKKTTETATNTSGEYVFPSLQPGAYTLNVESPGFRKAVVTALQLDAAPL
jgi:protocatechuate 3,4-dioxygenase beta subunit